MTKNGISYYKSPVGQQLERVHKSPVGRQLERVHKSPVGRQLERVHKSPVGRQLERVHKSPVGRQQGLYQARSLSVFEEHVGICLIYSPDPRDDAFFLGLNFSISQLVYCIGSFVILSLSKLLFLICEVS